MPARHIVCAVTSAPGKTPPNARHWRPYHGHSTLQARPRISPGTLAADTREALSALVNHPFPGNVRELENAVERAVVFAEKNILGLADLPILFTESAETEAGPAGDSLLEKVRRLETQEIRMALRESGGVKSRAARTLGITERMLAYKMKAYGIGAGPGRA